MVTRLLSAKELAENLGFAKVSNSFYEFCRIAGIKPVPGRRGWYDPKFVRYKLDCAQGLNSSTASNRDDISRDLVSERRARRASQ